MANVINVQLSNSETTITTGGTTNRNILSIKIVNTDTSTRTFSLYHYPSGGPGSDSNIIKKNYSILASDDYYFKKDELMVLGNGDVLSGIADVASKLTVTINYVDKNA